MDMKDKKLTVVGDVDPVDIVSKLRKGWHTDILTVGPAKEEKKEDGKKDEGKKDEKKDGDKKKDTEKQIQELVDAYKAYNPHLTRYYHVQSAEENPNACVICWIITVFDFQNFGENVIVFISWTAHDSTGTRSVVYSLRKIFLIFVMIFNSRKSLLLIFFSLFFLFKF